MNQPFEVPDELARAFRALAPALDRILVIGGWAHRLMSARPEARRPDFELLATSDCDLALPLELDRAPLPELLARLQDQGFREVMGGGYPEAAVRYVLTEREDFYLQFLRPRPHRRPDRAEVDALRGAGGLEAEALPFLRISRHRAWTITTRYGEEHWQVLIPNPAAFLMSKVLLTVETSRERQDRAKDLLYVHDTLLLFRDSLDVLRDEWTLLWEAQGQVRKRRLKRALGTHLSAGLSDETVSAWRIAQQAGRARPTTAEELKIACRSGLRTVIGEDLLPP